VTDEYLDYLIMSVQTFLGDSEVTRGPDFAFGKGTLPATNWYWRPYEEGGNCLNPILNCDPSAIPTIHAGSARGVSAPTGPLSNAIPQHIAVSGIDLESLKRAMG